MYYVPSQVRGMGDSSFQSAFSETEKEWQQWQREAERRRKLKIYKQSPQWKLLHDLHHIFEYRFCAPDPLDADIVLSQFKETYADDPVALEILEKFSELGEATDDTPLGE